MMPYDTYRLYQIERAKSPTVPMSKRPGWHPLRHRCSVASPALANNAEAIHGRDARDLPRPV